jgi:hypothetical protein
MEAPEAALARAPELGVVLTPLCLDTAGNAHAYVDFIRATVDYCL